MSAGKQKKRQINYANSEQYRSGKKTKSDTSNCLVSLKPHIGLKWDQYLRRVVPEKEQVGILWSDLAPFIENQEHCSGLADVTYVPPETFSLESLRGVLSYEVWSTCLTEAERKFLKQFLPSETVSEENVHLLLTGKNHHFGNPFLSWSSSLCNGDVHPDAILNKEKHIKKDEKAYRTNLLNYHSNMVDTLKKWRKRWLSCGDIENLFRDNAGNQKQVVMQPKATKGGMPMKVAPRIDVSKFMSYIKVSRTQLNHIKRLKQSGDGIQTKHVSRVIGGLDKSHVKPYGALLEDEQRRLREHWLNMSCNDLPAAFEVLKDRKVQMEKSRKLLILELKEKNVSVLRKADQLTDVTKELGQPGACENDVSPILQNDQVEHSPQSMLQGGDDQSTSLQDQDDEQTKYMETSIDSPNVENHDLMVVRGTEITSQREHSSDVQDHNGVSCIDKGISCCGNNPDKQSEDFTDHKLCKDGLGANSEDIQEISHKGTTINNYSSESQEIKSINNKSTHIDTLDCENLQLEDLDGVSYKGDREQDQDLGSISHDVLNHNCGHSLNISSEMSHPKMNTVIVDQEETQNVMMIPSNSAYLLPKSSGEQLHVEDFLDVDDKVAKGEKNRWQLGPLQSNYHPSDFYSGQQSSSAYLDNNGALSQQQDQLATSAFIMDNPSSVIESFSNLQNDGQLQMAKHNRADSYPLQHTNSIEQSTGLHYLPNNRLAQSAPFPRSLQEQHQLPDQGDNCIYGQLHKDYYSDVSLPTKVHPPISEQHPYAAFGSMGHRYNWFSDGQSHNNNLSGLESGNCLTQALPSGSNTDGTLFSAVSQYKQPSVHLGHVGASPSQLLEPRNQVCLPQNFLPRIQDTNPPYSDMYGYTQNMASDTSSQVATVGSLDGSHWTNFIQQDPAMPPDFTNRPFRGPWTR
ncbi:unnamed protein product [Urochloa decumbens]|uniref:DEUBAD domain-containing protein n=1 Tax=Urochloa decumbens TaxID=240449 RepID=A0ABC9FQ81_9POAL